MGSECASPYFNPLCVQTVCLLTSYFNHLRFKFINFLPLNSKPHRLHFQTPELMFQVLIKIATSYCKIVHPLAMQRLLISQKKFSTSQ